MHAVRGRGQGNTAPDLASNATHAGALTNAAQQEGQCQAIGKHSKATHS